MPFKEEKQALGDIIENILLSRSFIEKVTYTEFLEDKRTAYATIRALEIISEAVRRLTSEIYDRYSEIPWKNIKGAGNIYRHDYEDVLESMVWATIHHALPNLKAVIRTELQKYKEE